MIDNTKINWNDGRPIVWKYRQELECVALENDQLYGLVFYNFNPNNMKAVVKISWAGGDDEEVVLPAATKDTNGVMQSIGVLVLIHGEDSNKIVVRLSGDDKNAQAGIVESWIVSETMPTNPKGEGTKDIDNIRADDNKAYSLAKYKRLFRVPEARHYDVEVRTKGKNHFVVARFRKDSARISSINHHKTKDIVIYRIGPRANRDDTVKVVQKQGQKDSNTFLPSGGEQFVWMSFATEQDSREIELELKPSTVLYTTSEELAQAGIGS